MYHKEQFARDCVAALHLILTDDWFHYWSDEALVAAIVAIDPRQIEKSANRSIANAIMKANAFTEWYRPGTNAYRQIVEDISAEVSPIVNDYAAFMHYQLTLRLIMTGPKTKRPKRVMPVTAEQHAAMAAYLTHITHAFALEKRDFPPGVIDMMAYRARKVAYAGL
jgi:hypothetical protein